MNFSVKEWRTGKGDGDGEEGKKTESYWKEEM